MDPGKEKPGAARQLIAMATDVRSHPEGPVSEPASHEAEYAHPRDAHEPEVQRSVEYQQTPAPPLLRQDDPPLPAVENVLNSEVRFCKDSASISI